MFIRSRLRVTAGILLNISLIYDLGIYDLQFDTKFSEIRFAGAKLLKISLLRHKKGLESTFFHQKTNFFLIFVCFINTLRYICRRI
jgi:hypothetical protein